MKDLASKVADLATTVASFADKFTTKELVATNVFADIGTFGQLKTHQLCVDDVCITRDQFMSVFGTSALSQLAESAAGAQSVGGVEAAGGSSAALEDHADATTTTTPAASEPIPSDASLTPDITEAANDNQPVADGATSFNPASDQEPVPEASSKPEQLPEAANDNVPLPSAEAI